MSHSAVCWHCGASLSQLTLPLSRVDVCRQCRAELHVCRQCIFHDVSVAKQCREPIAEEVRDKQRANYCDYFVIRNDAFQPVATEAVQQARSQLDALFGGANSVTDSVTGQQTAADAARSALNDLFKKS